MRRGLCIAFAALALVMTAARARAHHAFGSEFEIGSPVTLRGIVTIMEWVNPHSWIHIDVKGTDGTVVGWMVEGGSPNALLRLGFTKNAVLPGMEIVVEGYQAKDRSQTAVGRSLTFADGRKLFLDSSAPAAR